MSKTAKHELSVFDDDGKEYKCQLSDVDRNTLEIVIGLIMPTTGSPKLITAGEMILNTCWVSGDDEIKNNEQLKIAACLSAIKIYEVKKTNLRKL